LACKLSEPDKSTSGCGIGPLQLEDDAQLAALMATEPIRVSLSDDFQLHPRQSTRVLELRENMSQVD
jgi:cobalamin-dependent methionine synthase I